MITIDGSLGEGGGQVLRTALGLSLVTGEPFRITRIRAGRQKPGLLRQHLTAVLAAAAIGDAATRGAELASQELEFRPRALRGGDHRFAIGTAGSTTLVLQAVLPALLRCAEPSRVTLSGGTHNPMAPPFEFLENVFFRVLRAMGCRIGARLHRHGLHPAGGGSFTVEVAPCARLAPVEILRRGSLQARRARALVVNLPRHVAERELAVVRERLGFAEDECAVVAPGDTPGTGNVVQIELEHEHVSELATAFGERGVWAETVARHAVEGIEAYLRSDAPVGAHLADQLLVPFALAGGGAFRTLPLSRHATTNATMVAEFLPVTFRVTAESRTVHHVEVRARA